MIRPVLTEFLLFLTPFVLYAVFLWATKSGVLDLKSWPLMRVVTLAIAALLLVLTLVGVFSGAMIPMVNALIGAVSRRAVAGFATPEQLLKFPCIYPESRGENFHEFRGGYIPRHAKILRQVLLKSLINTVQN